MAKKHLDLASKFLEMGSDTNLFHEMIDALPMAVYTTDTQGNLTYYNQAAADFSGRMPKLGSDKWCVSWKLFDKDGTPVPHETGPMAAALKENREIEGEIFMAEQPDGKRIWFEAYPAPLRDKSGNIIGGINVLIDITRHKKEESSLNTSKQRLQLALDISDIGSWEWDIKTNTVLWSENLEALHGMETGAFDGRFESFINVVHPDDREKVQQKLEWSLDHNAPYEIEHRWVRQNGEILWLKGKGMVVQDENGKPQKMIGTCTNITKQKQDKQLDQIQKNLLEQIATGLPMEECLSNLCSAVSEFNSTTRAAVFLVDYEGKKFNKVIAPHFSSAFKAAGEGISITDISCGTCVEAILKRSPIVCDDIPKDDSRSKEWRQLCEENNFKACVSNPIIDENNTPLGTFMISFEDPRKPDEWERRLSEFGRHIAGITLSRERSRTRIKEIEERFRNTMEQSPLSMQIFDADGNSIMVNPAWEKMWDASIDEIGEYNILQDTQLQENGIVDYVKRAFAGDIVKLPVTHYEPAKIGKKGRKRWIEGYIYPLTTREGRNEVALIHHDITERKETEFKLAKITEKIEQQKRLYETIFSSIPDLIYVFDLNYRFTFVNDALLDMWGLTYEEAIGKNLTEVGYEQWHVEMHEREIDKVIATKKPIRGEVPFTHSKLGERIYDYIFVPVINEKGEVEAISGATRDVTDRKVNEHANAWLGAIVESSDDAIISKNLDGIITSWNASAERLFGYTEEEAVGQPVLMLIPEDRKDEETTILNKIRNGKRVDHFETIRQRKDGKLLEISLTISPIRNSAGEIIGASKIARDITRQKQIQKERENLLKEIQKEQELLVDIFQNAPSFMCVLDGPEFEFEKANELFYQLVGNRDIIGKPIKEAIPEAEEHGIVELLEQVYSNGKSYVGTDVKLDLQTEDNNTTEYHIDFAFQPIKETDGTVSGIFIQGVDLTERYRAKKELQEINETLEERVQERTKALISYQDQLRSLASQLSKTEEQVKHKLASDLHDNLGQLLAVGKMKLDLLNKDQLSENTIDEMRDLADLLNEAIRYTRELMTDLKPPPSLDKEDLSASLSWIAGKMKKHNLNVIFADDEKPKPLSEEVRTTLRQCVKELLFNVVKHSGVNEAHLILSKQDDNVQIIIEDRGKGFNPEWKEPTPTEDGGFGLFNIRERINLLNGSIEIISREGRGTKVILLAPLQNKSRTEEVHEVNEETHEEQSASEKKFENNPKVTVLLVDDHQMMRRGLRKMIDSQDDMMVIAEAADGKDALKAANEYSPDVIVMDVNMPEMNGIEATREVMTTLPNTRIIGLSLHDNKEVAEAMRHAGAVAYLTKSEAFETLCATIRSEAQLTNQ